MKKTSPLNGMMFFLIIPLLIFSCKNSTSVMDRDYGAATHELISLLETNPDLKSMLEASIASAGRINPDPETNPVHSLDDYYEFVTHCETAMPWALQKRDNHSGIFDDIYQSLCCFYFLIDQPLPELEGKGLFNNTLQYQEPFASWLVRFSQSWGRYLDTEDSWNDDYYQMVLDDPAFGLQNGWYEDPSRWKTFNQFFSRYLSTPDQRPIASPDDPSVVASYADAVPQGTWTIDSNSNIVDADGVAVKSATLRSITALIGEDSDYRDAFAGGTLTHSFLNVNDYHRYHFPMGGMIKEIRIIPGINPAGGSLRWDAATRRYVFDPSSIGWQTLETRGCVILETESYGLVGLLPIGMAAVGSVNFEDYIKPGTRVEKGDMLGYFLFGGSDFILLFQEGVDFTLEAPKNDDGTYQHLLMGQQLGTLQKIN